MGLLGATLLVVMMVVVAEAQVVFPSNTPNKADDCTASNGQTGFCYEFRSRKFKECPYFPSMDSSKPDVERHLTSNICRNTGREVYFCCPSNNCNPGYRSHQDMCIETCDVKDCQANALCVEGSGTAASVCLCKRGYRSHNGECLPTCKATKCPKNARCLEGSGSTSTSCKCKNGYKSTRTACIELGPKKTVTQKFNPNILRTQGSSGSSTLQNQGNSRDQFQAPQYQYHYQNRPYNPFV